MVGMSEGRLDCARLKASSASALGMAGSGLSTGGEDGPSTLGQPLPHRLRLRREGSSSAATRRRAAGRPALPTRPRLVAKQVGKIVRRAAPLAIRGGAQFVGDGLGDIDGDATRRPRSMRHSLARIRAPQKRADGGAEPLTRVIYRYWRISVRRSQERFFGMLLRARACVAG